MTQEQFIDKAVQWLKENYRDFWGYVEYNDDPTEMFDLFRKDMEAVVKESLTTELTWQDCARIVEIADQMLQTAHDRVKWEDKSEEDYYTEILRRFNESKED